MIDTHCHLSFSQFDPDRDAALQRAGIVGVTRIVNPGTDLVQSRAAVELARRFSSVVSAGVGVHPQDLVGLTDDAFAELEQLAREPEVVAIGEVGLEISSRSPEVHEQERWLRRFVELAERVGKPVIFHVREAHPAFRLFLEKVWGPAPLKLGPGTERRGVVHCFSGDSKDAQFYAEHGLFLGITGIVTFPNAVQLCRAVEETSLEHLVLETDAPFLAPQSRRGKRNEPAYVLEVAEKVADLKGLSVAEVERVTDANAQRLFGRHQEAR